MFIEGTAGNDSLDGGVNDDTIEGLAGNDTLNGLGGNDLLVGGAGFDSLTGGDGDDTLAANGVESDPSFGDGGILDGGAGIDRAVINYSFLNLSFDVTDPSSSFVYLDSGGVNHELRNIEIVELRRSPFQVEIFELKLGTSGNDALAASLGLDLRAYGGAGADTITGGDNADSLFGGAGGDALNGGAGEDSIYGEAGADTLTGGADRDWFVFSEYSEISGDQITDLAAGDFIFLVPLWIANQELLFIGDNSFSGAAGEIRFSAGSGQTTIEFDEDGDAAVDRTIVITNGEFSLRAAEDSVRPSFSNRIEIAVIDPASSGADVLRGTVGVDTLSGLGGADTISGSFGDDSIDGGAGPDRLLGGVGDDTLTGGAGIDRFDFDRLDHVGAGGDVITDFSAREAVDFRSFSTSTLPPGTPGSLNLTFIGANAFSGAIGEYRYQTGGGQTEIQIDEDGDGVGDRFVLIQSGEFALIESSPDSGVLTTAITPATEGADNIKGTAAFDTIEGLGGNDTISGLQGFDQLFGGNGNDLLTGGLDNDILDGQGGNDSVSGGAGNDILTATAGFDTLSGGAGDDRFDIGALISADINGGDGFDRISFRFSSPLDFLDFEYGADPSAGFAILNGASNFRLTITGIELIGFSRPAFGTAGADFIDLAPVVGSVLVFGGAGNDTLHGLDQGDLIRGDAGADVIDGRDGLDTIYGGFGNDTINGGGGADTLEGGRGFDSLLGGLDTDRLVGDGGNDRLNGGDGADTLLGGLGFDRLEGAGGNDLIFGEGGNDTLRGASGADRLEGGAGVDVIFGGSGGDNILGGDGADRIRAEAGNDSVDGGEGNDRAFGSFGFDVMNGEDGNDLLDGDGGNDTLAGAGGNDTLVGDFGFDQLGGGLGADILEGNGGNDTLTGGGGNDTFRFALGDDSDLITDFAAGAGIEDVIELIGFGAAFDSFVEVQAAASQVGGNVLIDFGGGDTIRLLNTNLGDLHQDDFVFG